MRKLLLLLVALPAFAVPPTVSNVTLTYQYHGAVLVGWTASATYNEVKIVYDVSPNACDHVGTSKTQSSPGSNGNWQTTMALVLGGLSASTNYNICPQVSNDGGVTWSAPVQASFTTGALPSVHPELPIPPKVINTNYPSTSGYTVHTMDTNCLEVGTGEDIVQVTRDALFAQATGAVINIPPTAVCSPTTYTFDALAADATQFQPTDITIGSPGTIHSVAHGLTEKAPLVFGKQYGSFSSFPTGGGCEFGQGLLEGETFYAHVAGVTNPLDNFQVFCPDGVTLMPFASQGSVTNYFSWITMPRRMNWIIIRSSVSDALLPPEHTRLTPAWKSQMPTFQVPASDLGTTRSFVTFGDGDNNDQRMVGNIRFVGIRFTLAPSSQALTSSDPVPYESIFTFYSWNTDIILDRCFVDIPEAPIRIGSGSLGVPWIWHGNELAIVDSTLGPFTYFRASYTGLNATLVNTTHATVAAGTFYTGSSVINLPSTETITFSGSPSGGNNHGHIYFDMLASNAFTVATPAGVTVSCSPTACATAVSGSNNGACNVTDTWPKDGFGSVTVAPIACFDFSGSSLTGIGNADTSVSNFVSTDAISMMISGEGSGPWKYENNYLSGVGLPWHNDDDAGSSQQWVRGDYFYKHNYFQAPFKYMLGHPLSDHLLYYERQTVEWKGGRRIGLYGNIFDGGWALVDRISSAGPTYTSVNGLGITDIDMRWNTIIHSGNGIQGPATVADGTHLNTPPIIRSRNEHMLIVDVNTLGPSITGNVDGSAGNYWVNLGIVGASVGWQQDGPTGVADFRMSHVTVVGGNGSLPSIWRPYGVNTEGMSVTDNFLGFLYSGSQGITEEAGLVPSSACFNLLGKQAADCYFKPSYEMRQNVLQGGNGANQATVQGWWPNGGTVQNIVPSNQAISDIKFVNPAQDGTGDFHLRYDSPYKHLATDGTDIGANVSDTDAHQGMVYGVAVAPDTLLTTSAVVTFVAPDAQSCPVRVATTPWSPTVPTSGVLPFTDSGTTAGVRKVSMTSLTGNTPYYGKIFCAVQQPEFQFRTQSIPMTFADAISGMGTPVHDWEFGTGGGKNVTNITQLAADFTPYGIAGTTPINMEWSRNQVPPYPGTFNTTNFVFTTTSLDLTGTIPGGGGLFNGGINNGTIFTKATWNPHVSGKSYAFESSVRIPNSLGMWPAIFFYPITPGQADGSEIDVFEFYNMPGFSALNMTSSIHGPGIGSDFYNISGWGSPCANCWTPGTNFSSAFHLYQLLWTPTAEYVYVDGTLVVARNFTYTATGAAALITYMTIGSDLPGLQGLQPNSLGEFPMVYSVDHIKQWSSP